MLLAKHLRSAPSVPAAMQQTFQVLDDELVKQSRREGTKDGSTAVVCLLEGACPVLVMQRQRHTLSA